MAETQAVKQVPVLHQVVPEARTTTHRHMAEMGEEKRMVDEQEQSYFMKIKETQMQIRVKIGDSRSPNPR